MCGRGVHYWEGRVACDGCDLPTDSCLCELVKGLGPPGGRSGGPGGSGLRALPPGRPDTPPRRRPGRPPPRRPPEHRPSYETSSDQGAEHTPRRAAGFRIPAEPADPGVPSEPDIAVNIAREASELDARAAEWERGSRASRRKDSGRRRVRRRRQHADPTPAAGSSDDEAGDGSMTGPGDEPIPTRGAGTPERRLVRRRKRRP